MTRKFFRVITVITFLLTAFGIGALIWFPREPSNLPVKKQQRQTKVIVPQTGGTEQMIPEDVEIELIAYEERITAKAALNDGELLVSLLTNNFDDDPEEEQIIAYRNLTEKDAPIYITYIDFDESTQEYIRLWNAPTAATRPGTISIAMQDLIGDRIYCVILTGMNGSGEYTMTIFRKNIVEGDHFPFNKIAELRANGSISIQETQRTQAYQQGYAKGQSFSLVARSRDESSANPMDQKEVIYTFNEVRGIYEQSSLIHIPGKQIEQYRLQELLSSAESFERFIDGLWYYVSPQGTIDTRQYMYFDPQNQELIFYGDEAQQVFVWQHSSLTRYGLYVTSQNISVTNLKRSLDIELESLESIRVKVSEDVRIRIGVNASWDGSYRKATSLEYQPQQRLFPIPSYIEAQYNGSIGMLQFSENGLYTLSSGETNRKGKYAFFQINDYDLVEFRSEKGFPISDSKSEVSRELYLVEYAAKPEDLKEKNIKFPENLTLYPAQVSTKGVQKLHQPAIFLVAYNPMEEAAPQTAEEPIIPATEETPVPVLTFSSQPEYFSPDGDGVDDELSIFLGIQSVYPIGSWSFEIKEPQPPYQIFYRFEGKGKPADRLVWNGKSSKGELVQAATDYLFTFKAEDTQGGAGILEGHIGVDVLVIREGAGLRIQVPSIIFRAGYADFLELPKETVDNNNRVLRRIAEILNKFRDYRVLVEGHANRTQIKDVDAVEEERNELQPLSDARARSVVNYLVEFGVTRGRLNAIGMGSTKPVASLEDRNNWWKNRRVEFILIK
ncbi:MAG: pallilysin-related adhesin [Treponema sp.]|jgi:hypothetical protein|nr:pallilysin-related adhesin [Treponema sp.]